MTPFLSFDSPPLLTLGGGGGAIAPLPAAFTVFDLRGSGTGGAADFDVIEDVTELAGLGERRFRGFGGGAGLRRT